MERLNPLHLAYVHVIEGITGGARDTIAFDYDALRRRFQNGHEGGVWIVNNGYTRRTAITAVRSDAADMVAFGRAFISTPDLVNRLRCDDPLAPIDATTLYGGGAAGYTDYPVYAPPQATAFAHGKRQPPGASRSPPQHPRQSGPPHE
jgi:N-ethylmaleimide reductase